ncbi:MAG: zf-HC2 domain-containing protein [Oscillospiraceae bacterium]|nr:zf-HC2 domain-containing protein [Oscillospiraceae bacterium]
MNISCEIIRDLLPLYADNVCSEESKKLVEEHCGGCKECQSRLEAMKKPLPSPSSLSGEIRTPEKKPGDPLKKTRRHYIKLAVMTAVISTLIAVPLLVVWTISIKEKYSMLGEDMTWSAMAANGDMKKFGRLIVRGKYEKAFENVGFVGADIQYYVG